MNKVWFCGGFDELESNGSETDCARRRGDGDPRSAQPFLAAVRGAKAQAVAEGKAEAKAEAKEKDQK